MDIRSNGHRRHVTVGTNDLFVKTSGRRKKKKKAKPRRLKAEAQAEARRSSIAMAIGDFMSRNRGATPATYGPTGRFRRRH